MLGALAVCDPAAVAAAGAAADIPQEVIVTAAREVPASDADVPHIVGLMNLAYRGVGTSSGWATEVGYIAGDRTTEHLLRADLAAKPEASTNTSIWPPPAVPCRLPKIFRLLSLQLPEMRSPLLVTSLLRSNL